MHWVMPTLEVTPEELLAMDMPPHTSPRNEDLSAGAQDQVKKAMAACRGLVKASTVPGTGRIRLNASGYYNGEKVVGEANFVALNISRVD